jgi:hypothetical protein
LVLEAKTVYEGKDLVSLALGFVETVREDGKVVYEGEKPDSREQAASAKPLLLGLSREVWETVRASRSCLRIP